jgi:hypothetical protein
VPPEFNYGSCSGTTVNQYTNNPSDYDHPSTDDAIDDAVYRLLNETLDTAIPKGILDDWVEYNGNMTFDAEGRIGVQALWGPLQMRLIVWA